MMAHTVYWPPPMDPLQDPMEAEWDGGMMEETLTREQERTAQQLFGTRDRMQVGVHVQMRVPPREDVEIPLTQLAMMAGVWEDLTEPDTAHDLARREAWARGSFPRGICGGVIDAQGAVRALAPEAVIAMLSVGSYMRDQPRRPTDARGEGRETLFLRFGRWGLTDLLAAMLERP